MAPKIQHKRSAVAGKAPQPADLDYGEIGVNYEATDPALYIKDSADAIRKIGNQPDASETTKGIVELATAAETTTGTDATRAVHPAGLKVELDKKASLASPALTGTPTAPTAAAGTNTTQLATTAFVTAAVAVENLWNRAGTVVSPTTAGDRVQISAGTAALPGLTPVGDPNTGIYSPGADQVAIGTGGSERARIDNSGRLLLGQSSSLNVGGGTGAQIQIAGTVANYLAISRWINNFGAPAIALGKSRGASPGTYSIVQSGDDLGYIFFAGDDGVDLESTAASISCEVDGTPGANIMPGRLVFSTTAGGASSPTERMRITSDGVRCYNQAAPVSYAAAATLVIGDLKNGLIQYTGSAATLTLPTGTLTEGGFAADSLYINITFEWSVINTGSGTCTIGAGYGHTIVGGATVAAGASGRFASRRIAVNTFVSYRLS